MRISAYRLGAVLCAVGLVHTILFADSPPVRSASPSAYTLTPIPPPPGFKVSHYFVDLHAISHAGTVAGSLDGFEGPFGAIVWARGQPTYLYSRGVCALD